MSYILLNIICMFIFVRVHCLPQDINTVNTNGNKLLGEINLANTEQSHKAIESKQAKETSHIFKIKISRGGHRLKETSLGENLASKTNQQMIDKLTRKKEVMKDEKLSHDLQQPSFVQAKTFLELAKSVNSNFEENPKRGEAMRNERDMREALLIERQLLELADTSSPAATCQNDKECRKCNRTENKLKCFNETVVGLCTANGNERLIRCTGSTPVCHPTLNVCTSRRMIDRDVTGLFPNDENQPTIIKCPSNDGYYPDMKSCRKFYYCSNQQPYLYQCANNEVYNPLTRACAVQTATTPCRRFHCEGKHGRYTSYPGDPTVYAICTNNKAVELLHCPIGQAMHERSQQCQTHCMGEGLIADYTSCTHFYECTRTFPGAVNSFKITHRMCPPDMVFHPLAMYCVPQVQYQPCDIQQQQEEEATTNNNNNMNESILNNEMNTQPSADSYTTVSTDSTTYTEMPMEVTTLQ